MFFSLLHFGKYSIGGKGQQDMLVISRIFSVFADILSTLLLICLAKGWTVVAAKLSIMGRVKIAIYSTTYIAVGIGAILTFYTFLEQEVVAFFYSSAPGVTIIILRIVACFWFYYSVHITRRKFNTKVRGFSARHYDTS